MTIDIRNVFEQGYAEGYAASEAKMASFARLMKPIAAVAAPWEEDEPKKQLQAAPKAIAATKAPKAPVVTRGVKKVAKTRTKGVKEAIKAVLSASLEGVTISDIVSNTGFKEASVRSTLATLRKAGVTFQDGNRWAIQGGKLWSELHRNVDGNSEASHADV